MKFFTATALLAAALFSAVVVIPFLPNAQPRGDLFFLEARLAATVDTHVQFYYDTGFGFSEANSVQHTVAKNESPRLCRFPLPAGTHLSLRFDPLDRAGTATLHGPLRIVTEAGRVLRTIPFSEIEPMHQIESARVAGDRFDIVTASTADDPQMVIKFTPPLRLAVTLSVLARSIAMRALPVFAALALILFWLDRAPRLRGAARKAGGWLQRRPARATAIVAALAVAASAYPVVFLGKSYVSPNFGYLLYETFPTLPGGGSREVAETNGTDLGPALWQNVPYAFIQRHALERGELPLWNRYALTGTPLLAQGQSMFGDPLHFVVLLFDSAAWAWDLKFLLAKWLFAFALGSMVLAVTAAPLGPVSLIGSSLAAEEWATRTRLVAALLVTVAAPFIGFFVYRVNHPAFFSVCYAPWVLLCWVRVAAATERRSTVWWLAGLFGANFALLNSGTAKEAALLIVQMNLVGACVLLTRAAPWSARLARLAGAAAVGGIVLLVGAPMWATFLQTLPGAYTASSTPSVDQIQPSLLLGAFDELFYRPLSRGEIVFNPSLNFLYLLGLLYFVVTLRRPLVPRTALVLAGGAMVAAAIAFGVVPPAWLAQVPFLAHVGHLDNCFTCGLIVFGAVLSGIGFATAAERIATREGRGDLIAAGALLVALVCAWIGFRQAAHRELYGPGTTFSPLHRGEVIAVSPFIWGSLVALLLASAGFALIVRHAMARKALTPAAAIFATLCLTVLLWRHGLHAAALGFDTFVVQPPPRGNFHAKSSAVTFLQAGHAREPGRVFGMHGNLTPDWNAVYGLEAIHGPDALQNPWLRQLIDVSPAKWNSTWRVYAAARDVGAVRPFFDALNVRYYVDLSSNPPLVDSSLTLTERADLDVYESRTAWPRAFFANTVTTYDAPPDLMKKILTSNGRPFAAVTRDELTAQRSLSPVLVDAAEPAAIPATNYRLTENTTSFDVHATSAGVAVLTEAWWPSSFRAEINGQRAPLIRVNHAFKGVALPAAGDYRVTFSYWPKNFARNLTLGVVGAVLGVIALLFALRTARNAGKLGSAPPPAAALAQADRAPLSQRPA